MAGGNIVLGVAFGSARAAQAGLSALDTDKVKLTVSERNLPILLAVGRVLHRRGFTHLPTWIRGRILQRRMEARRDLDGLVADEEESKDRRLRIQARHDLFGRALDMADGYDWTTTYDVIRKAKGR
jgi:hypothetical protein